MTRSLLARTLTCVIACAGLSIFTRGTAAQIMSAPAAPNAASGSALADWNITYKMPANWRVGQTIGRLQMIVSNTDAGMIFLAPGMYATPQDAIADLSVFYQQMQMQAYPVEQPAMGTIAGLQSITAMYASADQMGRMVQGRYIALLTPHGTGVSLLAMTTQDKMPALRTTLDQLAATVKAEAPSVNRQAMAALAGRWIYWDANARRGGDVGGNTSNSYEETLEFDGQGGYRWSSAATVNVRTPINSSGAGSAGGSTSNGDQGAYTVIGNTLVFKGTKGQLAVDFQIGNGQLIAAGKQYLRQ